MKWEGDYVDKAKMENTAEIKSKVGTTTYIVTATFNNKNSDTPVSKILRLIKDGVIHSTSAKMN